MRIIALVEGNVCELAHTSLLFEKYVSSSGCRHSQRLLMKNSIRIGHKANLCSDNGKCDACPLSVE
jgi:hypothetical protein